MAVWMNVCLLLQNGMLGPVTFRASVSLRGPSFKRLREVSFYIGRMLTER